MARRLVCSGTPQVLEESSRNSIRTVSPRNRPCQLQRHPRPCASPLRLPQQPTPRELSSGTSHCAARLRLRNCSDVCPCAPCRTPIWAGAQQCCKDPQSTWFDHGISCPMTNWDSRAAHRALRLILNFAKEDTLLFWLDCQIL